MFMNGASFELYSKVLSTMPRCSSMWISTSEAAPPQCGRVKSCRNAIVYFSCYSVNALVLTEDSLLSQLFVLLRGQSGVADCFDVLVLAQSSCCRRAADRMASGLVHRSALAGVLHDTLCCTLHQGHVAGVQEVRNLCALFCWRRLVEVLRRLT